LDDHHTLRLLTIYDDWLWNTLLAACRYLAEDWIGRDQQAHD
jgi:hypothetical protein